MKSKEPGTIRQLFAFVGENNGKMLLSIFLAVLGELFGIGPFLMVAVLADALYWGTAAPTLVLFLCGGAAVCQIIKMLLTWRSSLMSHKISFTILKNIREAITGRMAKIPMGVMLETPTGAFKNLIVDNVAKLEDSMAHFMPELPSNIAAPLCSILLIFLLDWRMGLAALVTIPLGTLFFAAMMRGYGPRMENYMRSANEMNSALVEYVNGIQVIKAFNRSAASYGKYADSVRYFHDSTMAWWSQCWLWNAAARAVLPSTLLGTLPVGAWLYMEGSLSLHVFLVALVVPLGFIAPLMKVSEAMEQVSMIKGNLEQVTAFLKTPELVRPTEPAELGERCYQFEDVHFAYNELEQGYDTMAGDAGARLSGGERQRITIARAMLKQASVIILDEATAYADPENEALIQQAISKLVVGKSLIVVAHRLNTIRNADQILVVANGEIVGRGIQEELLQSCPLYRKMWQDYTGSTEGGAEDV